MWTARRAPTYDAGLEGSHPALFRRPVITVDLHSLPLLLLLGAVTGLIGSLLGVGGGVFLVPALVLLFHVPMHFAVGTGLFVVIATSSSVGAFQLNGATPNLRLGVVLLVATLLGAVGGGLAADLIPASALIALFGGILIPVGILMWRKPRRDPEEANPTYTVRRIPAALSVSFVAGAISGLLGVGGGILQVPALSLLSRVPTRVAVATSNFMIGLTAVASAFIYFLRGQVSLPLTSAIILGVIAGALGGIRVSRALRVWQVRRVFAVVVWITAVQMLLRASGRWIR